MDVRAPGSSVHCIAVTRQRVTSGIGNTFEKYASEAEASNDVAGHAQSHDIAIKGKGLLHVGKGYYTGQRKFEFGSDRSLLVCSHRPSTNSSFPHQRAELH